jgi:hypothetical protein
MRNFFKSFDKFGTVVGLHFGNWLDKEEGRSPAYSTSIGGIFTMMSQTIFFASLAYYLKILINRDNNSIFFQTQATDWDALAR